MQNNLNIILKNSVLQKESILSKNKTSKKINFNFFSIKHSVIVVFISMICWRILMLS